MSGKSELLLRATDLCVGYGKIPAVHDLNLEISRGEVVALLGANGAGKTTSIRALAGDLKPLSGTLSWRGGSGRHALTRLARRGLAYVSEERSVFMSLTCEENLRLGLGSIEAALEWMPELSRLMKRRAGLLSGGEQQMLTLARALAANPDLLLVDEISHGLAPIIVRRLLESIRRAAEGGTAVVLVEQQVRPALALCDRAIVLRRGRAVLEGDGADLANRLGEIEGFYLSAVAGSTEPPSPESGPERVAGLTEARNKPSATSQLETRP
jgi:branched-chain amino acid transport system ATP-binding protein